MLRHYSEFQVTLKINILNICSTFQRIIGNDEKYCNIEDFLHFCIFTKRVICYSNTYILMTFMVFQEHFHFFRSNIYFCILLGRWTDDYFVIHGA